MSAVIFSRLNPGEKLVVGCRKAAVAADAQVILLQHSFLENTLKRLFVSFHCPKFLLHIIVNMNSGVKGKAGHCSNS